MAKKWLKKEKTNIYFSYSGEIFTFISRWKMVIKCPKKKKIFTLLSRFVDSESRHVERTLQEMEDFSPIGSAILNKSGVILPFSSGWSILHWIHNNSHNEKHHLYICSWSKRSPQCCLTLSTSLLEASKLRVLTGLNWESGDDWLSGGLKVELK